MTVAVKRTGERLILCTPVHIHADRCPGDGVILGSRYILIVQPDIVLQPNELALEAIPLVHQLGQIGQLRGAADLIGCLRRAFILFIPGSSLHFFVAGSIIYTDGLLGRVDLYRPFPTEGVPVFPIKAVPNRAGRHQRDLPSVLHNDLAYEFPGDIILYGHSRRRGGQILIQYHHSFVRPWEFRMLRTDLPQFVAIGQRGVQLLRHSVGKICLDIRSFCT